jgi:hypothetical protein
VSPPNEHWGRNESGRAGSPPNPGTMPRPMTADTATRMTRPTRSAMALPHATAGRGGWVAVVGPRRGSQGRARSPTGRWTERKRWRQRERRSGGLSRMRFPRQRYERRSTHELSQMRPEKS